MSNMYELRLSPEVGLAKSSVHSNKPPPEPEDISGDGYPAENMKSDMKGDELLAMSISLIGSLGEGELVVATQLTTP